MLPTWAEPAIPLTMEGAMKWRRRAPAGVDDTDSTGRRDNPGPDAGEATA